MPANTPSPDSEQLARCLDKIDADEARLRRLCADQPEQAAVRTVLVNLEKAVHVAEGWGSLPRLFALGRHEHSGRISPAPAVRLTAALHQWVRRERISYPQAVSVLSVAMEWLRHEVDPSSVDPGPMEMLRRTPQLLSYIESARQHPDADLFRLGPGQVFQGMGLLMEGWWAPNPEGRAAGTGAALPVDDLEASPYSFENRAVFYAARDGFMWEAIRFRRRADGVTLPRRCRVFDPDAPLGGSLAVSLSRICNAVAGNPVPIRRYDPQSPQRTKPSP